METINPQQEHAQSLAELHYEISEFIKTFEPLWEKHLLGERRQRPFCRLSLCEIMTILVAYQLMGGQHFKQFYQDVICQYHRPEFPRLVSYQRFVEAAPLTTIPLVLFLQFRMEMSAQTGLYVIDSTALAVCLNLRIKRHKVFKNIAQRSKTSTGWFYGFKLHLVINHLGQLMALQITAGNVDDRIPVLQLVKKLKGKLLGDKGYIKQTLLRQLFEQGLQLITTLRKNMKPQVMTYLDRLLLRKRSIIETINDLLKNHFQIEHSRHRSLAGFINCVLTGLIAYTFYPNKPAIRGVELQKALALVSP